MSELEPAEQFTALDFAVIALLQRVSCEVVEPKIFRWKEDLKGKAQIAPRLAAGFLAVWPHLGPDPKHDALKRQIDDFVWGRQQDVPVDALTDLLESSGHFLFNSYYYILLDEFGEKGLVPAIPGCTSATERKVYKSIQRLIQRSRLPLHLNEDYLDTYSTLLMPLRAGITPRFLQLAFSGFGPATCLVGNFLGDLALLQKREDFVHRHFAALLVAMNEADVEAGRGSDVPMDSKVGAFVLTAAIPDAFDREDETRLGALVRNTWTNAPLEVIHSSLRRDSRAIKCGFDWTGSNSTQQEDVTTQQIRNGMREALGQFTKEGWYLLRGCVYDSGDQVARLAAINVEGLDRVFACQFPAGPWLDPALVAVERIGRGGQPVVDGARLAMLCRAIDQWSSPSVAHADRLCSLVELMKNPGFAGVIRAVFPDLAIDAPDCADRLRASFAIEPVRDRAGQQQGRLLVLRGPATGSSSNPLAEMGQSTADAVGRIARSLSPAFDEYLLPGATNTFLARLRRTWNETFAFGRRSSEEVPGDDDASILAHAVYDLMEQDPTIRGIALLLERETYIPEPIESNCEDANANVMASLLAYPSFWLFESLCHMLVDKVRIEPFRSRSPSSQPDMWAPPFRSEAAKESLILSADDDANRAFASGLTYLGLSIRACGITSDQVSNGVWIVNPASLSYDITELYHNHLKTRLENGSSEPSLQRVWADSALAGKVSRVEVLWPDPQSKDQIRPSEITFRIVGDSFAPILFRWKTHRSCEVAFTAFSERALLAKHMDVCAGRLGHDRLTLAMSGVNATGVTGQWILDENGDRDLRLVALFEILAGEITKLKRTFRAGEVERQLRLAHEMRRDFPHLRMLFADPTINGISDENVKRKIKRSKTSLKLIELNTAALSEFASKDYLFPQSSSAPKMALYLIELGITDGVQSADLDLETVAPSMESLLNDAAVWGVNITLDGIQFPPDTLPTAPRRLKAQKIILTAVANAAKHLSSFVLERLCDGKDERIDHIRTMPLFHDLLGVRVQRDRVVVWNLGSENSGDEFRRIFCNGQGQTYSVLNSLVREKVWDSPGEVFVDAAPPSSAVYRAAGQQLHHVSVYTISIRLPEPLFQETS